MKKIISRSLCAAASIAIAAAAATPAEAQRVNRIVAFGDSYADDGNLFELVPAAYTPQARQVYPTGRFSGGTNFVDTMAQLLNVPVDNFAIGGAFTGNGNINGPGIPGFVTEYQSFLAGGGPAAFPRVSGRFGPTDLLVVSIGGNDARAYERSLGLDPTPAQVQGLIAGAPAQAQLRVAETTTGLNALVGAGARNITFLAGDVGRLPEVAGRPIAAVGSAYATAFNTGIQATLAGYASQGVIVNYLDLNRIADVVGSNLSAFGLQSAGACPTACVSDAALATRYLFYVDQLHLTSAGFAIVGRYAVRQLEAPLHLQAQTDVGLQAASSFGNMMQGRLDLSDARFGAEGGAPLRLYLSGNFARRDRPDTLQSLAYSLDAAGVSGGAEYDAGGGFVLGGAVNWTRAEAEMGLGTGEARADALQLGLYAGWSGGGAFVEGYAGIGWLGYEISREAVIDTIQASPDGRAFTAGGRIGYLAEVGAVRVGPFAGLRHTSMDIDAFTETGDPVLTLNVGEQEASSLIGSIGVEGRASIDVGGLAVRPFAAVALEKELEDDPRTIRYAGTASPTIVNSWTLPGRSTDVYGRVSGGVDLALGSSIALQLTASTSIQQDGGNDMTGSLALRIGF